MINYIKELVYSNEITATPEPSPNIQLFFPGLSLLSQNLPQPLMEEGQEERGLDKDLSLFMKKVENVRVRARTRALHGVQAGKEAAPVKVEDPLTFWFAQVRAVHYQ